MPAADVPMRDGDLESCFHVQPKRQKRGRSWGVDLPIEIRPRITRTDARSLASDGKSSAAPASTYGKSTEPRLDAHHAAPSLPARSLAALRASTPPLDARFIAGVLAFLAAVMLTSYMYYR